ncbi:hypothetical protein BWO91_16745 [Plantibacter flavus]|nr:hypothetical protein BWO91_16745 [Plantibacter flavus]
MLELSQLVSDDDVDSLNLDAPFDEDRVRDPHELLIRLRHRGQGLFLVLEDRWSAPRRGSRLGFSARGEGEESHRESESGGGSRQGGR